MIALVGYTGFVGSNLYGTGCFDAVYNSKNITDSYGTKPDLLVYAGLRAEKYLANHDPKKDMEMIIQAEDNIQKINPQKLVLISTIDVFQEPKNVDENTEINTEHLHAYGYDRYQLERWVRDSFSDALIIRLPGLYGHNIKKNFIYDYINVIPFMLKCEKMQELLKIDSSLADFYQIQDNGFYKVTNLNNKEKELLKNKFRNLEFNALHFTDSRSIYQFYPLNRLWQDIQTALEYDIRLWHPATEPVSAGELYKYMTGDDFVNELSGNPAYYDYKTIWDKQFNGIDGYIMSKRMVLEDVKRFILDEERKRQC